MKKRFPALFSALIIITMIFCSCVSFPSFNDTVTTTKPQTTTQPVENIPDPSVSETVPSTEAPTEITTQAEEKTTQTPDVGDGIIGYTSKGYIITRENGIYYVDGILIANKTYALPSDYNPGTLLSECSSAFESMKADAASQGLTIWNASGFRSYSLQESLYTRYSNRDGKAAADRYSARPGHSEHQTGLAIDLNDITSAFANTAAGEWIAENCWKYGFILRYLKGKEAETGYMYEPWHIRYVGTEAAEKIYNSGLCLEEYYGITSIYDAPLIPAGGTIYTAEEKTTAAPTENIVG